MQASTASDVYSFAVTAWEVLSCRLPYHTERGEVEHDVLTLKSMIALVSGRLRPDVGVVRADCPPALLALVQRCWDSEPRRRPGMPAVVVELERIVAAGSGAGADGDAAAAMALPGMPGGL